MKWSDSFGRTTSFSALGLVRVDRGDEIRLEDVGQRAATQEVVGLQPHRQPHIRLIDVAPELAQRQMLLSAGQMANRLDQARRNNDGNTEIASKICLA